MAEISSIGASGGASNANKLMSNVMLDFIQQSMEKSGVKESPETKSAMQGLRDSINGNQQQAAQQVQGGDGSSGAGPTQGAGSPEQGGANKSGGLMQMMMQVLQMIMQLMSQMQQGGQEQGGTNSGAGNFAQKLPQGGSPLDTGSDSSGDMSSFVPTMQQ